MPNGVTHKMSGFFTGTKVNCYLNALLVQCLLAINFTLIFAAPVMAQNKVELRIDVSKTGAKIDRNIFGQFAEHLGHGVYEGIWVGPNSRIPNTRGIRNDVVAALTALKV